VEHAALFRNKDPVLEDLGANVDVGLLEDRVAHKGRELGRTVDDPDNVGRQVGRNLFGPC